MPKPTEDQDKETTTPTVAEGQTTEQIPVAPNENEGAVEFNEDAFAAITGQPLSPQDASVAAELEKEEKAALEREKRSEESSEKSEIDTGAPDVIPEDDQEVEEEVETTPDSTKAPETTQKVPATARPLQSLGDDEIELNDTDKSLLKKMATDARDFTIARLKELRQEKARRAELEEKLKGVDQPPQQWFENPDAYVHLPEYKKASQVVNYAKSLQNHYTEQLKRIKNGDNWTDLVIGADGKLQQVTRESSADSDIIIADKIAEARLAAQTYTQQIQQIQGGFQQRVKSVFDGIKQAEDEFFPQFSDPKVAEADPNYKFMSDALKAKGAGGNILSGMMSKMYAEFVKLQQKLTETETQLKGRKQIKSIKELAQPSADEISAGGGGKVKETNPDKIPFLGDKFEELTGVKV